VDARLLMSVFLVVPVILAVPGLSRLRQGLLGVSSTLVRKHVAKQTRKWVLETTSRRFRRFLIPPTAEPKPPGEREETWYTECVERAQNLIQDWVEAMNKVVPLR